jgi:SSS family solute:Na+ symporter
VVVTESIQSVILILGAIVVTAFAVLALPSHGIHTLAAFKAAVKPDQLSMLQTRSSAGLNWYAIFLGYPILGIWYWCTDQTIVQRVLGSRTEKDAQYGALFAGLLKILPLFLLVFPGVVGYVLFRDVIGADPNQTLPVLLVRLIPTGLKGIIAAGLLAALMSTIAAALNSSATLVAVDIVKRLKPETSDRVQVRIGQISTVVVMLLAMAWSTQGGRYTSIFEAINTIASYLAPPITAVFLWGVFWKRGTRQAALTTLIAGFLIGVVSFLIDLPVFGTEKVITRGLGIPFMMQAWWMFCLCSLIFVIVSLLTPRPDPESIAALTWKSPAAVLTHGRIKGLSDPRILAGGLLAILTVLYIIFH